MPEEKKKPDASCLPYTNFFLIFDLLFFIKHLNVKFKIKNKLKEPTLKSIRVE